MDSDLEGTANYREMLKTKTLLSHFEPMEG
jgi:hypothetical protein